MKNEPLVSVVIATYKREETLKRAINSIKNQTYKNIEVIIVDDNEGDVWNNKVFDIVSELQENSDITIKLVSDKKNKGSAKARNEGIFLAKGEFITFLDDDDEYLPEKIEEQVTHLIDNNADVSLTNLCLYNESGKLVDKRVHNYIKQLDNRSLLIYHLKYHLTGTDTFMFKAKFIKKIGGFPLIDIGDEFYLILSSLEKECKMVYLNRCDVRAYVHKKNEGLSFGESKIDGENILWEKKKKYFDILSRKDIRYIKMRHYAVLAVAYNRCKRRLMMCIYLIRSFVSYPLGFVSLFLKHKKG